MPAISPIIKEFEKDSDDNSSNNIDNEHNLDADDVAIARPAAVPPQKPIAPQQTKGPYLVGGYEQEEDTGSDSDASFKRQQQQRPPPREGAKQQQQHQQQQQQQQQQQYVRIGSGGSAGRGGSFKNIHDGIRNGGGKVSGSGSGGGENGGSNSGSGSGSGGMVGGGSNVERGRGQLYNEPPQPPPAPIEDTNPDDYHIAPGAISIQAVPSSPLQQQQLQQQQQQQQRHQEDLIKSGGGGIAVGADADGGIGAGAGAGVPYKNHGKLALDSDSHSRLHAHAHAHLQPQPEQQSDGNSMVWLVLRLVVLLHMIPVLYWFYALVRGWRIRTRYRLVDIISLVLFIFII
ncbi:hypothetical protein HDU76_014099 [Blyttiomyces sp. JEL0837]|nr:hypothetical protein HDU76_014099 [Blyttiomyces sp. JEL0837]